MLRPINDCMNQSMKVNCPSYLQKRKTATRVKTRLHLCMLLFLLAPWYKSQFHSTGIWSFFSTKLPSSQTESDIFALPPMSPTLLLRLAFLDVLYVTRDGRGRLGESIKAWEAWSNSHWHNREPVIYRDEIMYASYYITQLSTKNLIDCLLLIYGCDER